MGLRDMPEKELLSKIDCASMGRRRAAKKLFHRFCCGVFRHSRCVGLHSPPIGLNGVADRVAVQHMKFAVMADLGAAVTITREGPERSRLPGANSAALRQGTALRERQSAENGAEIKVLFTYMYIIIVNIWIMMRVEIFIMIKYASDDSQRTINTNSVERAFLWSDRTIPNSHFSNNVTLARQI